MPLRDFGGAFGHVPIARLPVTMAAAWSRGPRRSLHGVRPYKLLPRAGQCFMSLRVLDVLDAAALDRRASTRGRAALDADPRSMARAALTRQPGLDHSARASAVNVNF